MSKFEKICAEIEAAKRSMEFTMDKGETELLLAKILKLESKLKNLKF